MMMKAVARLQRCFRGRSPGFAEDDLSWLVVHCKLISCCTAAAELAREQAVKHAATLIENGSTNGRARRRLLILTNARYRIQAVSEMTGIPSATLRAWERRYGVPNPSRTNSSYRLYSHDDVAKIKLIKELCDQGLAPSDAELTRTAHRKQGASDQGARSG